jgi:hypothetical protein
MQACKQSFRESSLESSDHGQQRACNQTLAVDAKARLKLVLTCKVAPPSMTQ